MNISHELKDDVIVLLNITISRDEIKDKVAEQLKQMRKTAQMPGFRPGKTPEAIIEKKYGKAIRFDIINKRTSQEVSNYLKEQGIKTVGGILMEQDDNSYTPEQTDYEIRVSTGLLPKFDATFDNSLTLPHYTIKTDESEIDEMITNAQQGYGERNEVEDVQEKDILYVAVQELNDKGEHNLEGITLEETFLMPQYVTSEEIRKEILQAHKGDTLTIDLHKAYDGSEVEIASFLQIEKEEVQNHKNPFEIKINRILRNTPHALDEKLFKLMLGPETKVSTEEELRAELQKMLEERNVKMTSDLFTTTVSHYILEQIKDLPISKEHLQLLLNEDPEETQEEHEKRANSILPYLRYQYILNDLKEQMGVEISEELVRSILADDVKRRIQAAGLGQLLSNDEFLNRIIEDTLDKNGEEVFKAREQAKEQAFANKVKELVTLDEQEAVSIEEFYEIFGKEQDKVNALLGYAPKEDEEASEEA